MKREETCDLSRLATESRNPASLHLDQMSSFEIVSLMNREDAKTSVAVGKVLDKISQVVDQIVVSFQKGGRLIYLGAGTSGRLGVLDASECVPTFGVDPSMVVGVIAGGDTALRHAVEGAEDDRELGKKDLDSLHLTNQDVVVGLAASGRTPYVVGGLKYAKSQGAFTACVVCSPNSLMKSCVDVAIELNPGPEVLTGSTRLKAGTVQKMVLNMLTTASMVKIGKAYQNLMVDVVASNLKLKQRAISIVSQATGLTMDAAQQALLKAQGEVKTAIVMILTGYSLDEARTLLAKHHNHIGLSIQNRKGE